MSRRGTRPGFALTRTRATFMHASRRGCIARIAGTTWQVSNQRVMGPIISVMHLTDHRPGKHRPGKPRGHASVAVSGGDHHVTLVSARCLDCHQVLVGVDASELGEVERWITLAELATERMLGRQPAYH